MRKSERNELDSFKLHGCRISQEIRYRFGHAYRILEWLDGHGYIVRRAISPGTSIEKVRDIVRSVVVGTRHVMVDDEPDPRARLPRR